MRRPLRAALTVPGKRDDGRIIVGAHYDGSGLGDNGSGVALLLATAAGLAHVEPEFTVQYIFFDREEEGGACQSLARWSEREYPLGTQLAHAPMSTVVS